MGVLSKANQEGRQGRKEGKWWRVKDNALPIGKRGAGCQVGRREK